MGTSRSYVSLASAYQPIMICVSLGHQQLTCEPGGCQCLMSNEKSTSWSESLKPIIQLRLCEPGATSQHFERLTPIIEGCAGPEQVARHV